MGHWRGLKDFLTEGIWKPEIDTARTATAYLGRALRWLFALVREVRTGDLEHRAMSLAYTTLISLVPMLAVSFSMLKAFGVHSQLEPFLLRLLEPLGEKAGELTSQIVGFVENVQVGILGFVGFAALFYTAISLLQKIEDSLNRLWRTEQSGGWFRRFGDYLSVILVGPVFVFSAIGVMASMADTGFVQDLIAQEPFGTLYYLVGVILPYVLIIAAFTFVYAFLLGTRVQLASALAGGTFAGVIWKAVGALFTAFVAGSVQYSAIYSGFAIVIVSMIWLYISWLILLLGGVVAFYHQHPRYLRLKTHRPQSSHRSKEYLTVLLMVLIGQRFLEGQAPWSREALADALSLPWESIEDALRTLLDHGLLVRVAVEPPTYVPGRALSHIFLREVVDAARGSTTEDDLRAAPIPGDPLVRDLFTRIDESIGAVLDAQSLSSFLSKGSAMQPNADQFGQDLERVS